MLNDINNYLKDLCRDGDGINNEYKCRYINPQPGHYCGMTKKVNKKETTCKNLRERVLCDNPSIKIAEKNEKCPSNYYKGALTVNPNKQYHFYRQDSNGTWSHKDGGGEATNVDASGNTICDPKLADRDYSNLVEDSKFKKFCNYFCIPKNDYQRTCVSRNNPQTNKFKYRACDSLDPSSSIISGYSIVP